MKKYLLCGLIISCFLLIGCGKNSEKGIINDLNKKINKTESYHLTGTLEIMNNEDKFLYDVEVGYQKDNNFKVSLKNKTNNHEQIILRNEEGIFVLTPSLNKSFKFQSEWPYNNSQAYLLQTIIKDIENDKEKTFEKNENGYLIGTKVNYGNNKSLIKQKIQIDKELNIKEVQILNDSDGVQMKMTFNDIDYKATFDNNYFALNNNMKTSTESVSNTLGSVVYPMYVPTNTHLTAQEKIKTENGERIILTFSGESPFMVVQENSTIPKELLTIPMYGEPYVITGTVGALSDSSITWASNGIDYYVVSEVLSSEQLLNVANSINATNAVK